MIEDVVAVGNHVLVALPSLVKEAPVAVVCNASMIAVMMADESMRDPSN